MALVRLSEQILTDIADAVRSKNKKTDKYTPGQIAQAIKDLKDTSKKPMCFRYFYRILGRYYEYVTEIPEELLNILNAGYKATDISNMFGAADVNGKPYVLYTNGGYPEFSRLTNIPSFNIDISSITKLYAVYFDCINAISINFDWLKNNSATDISYLFYDCSSNKKWDFNNFKTDLVTDAIGTFYNCDLSNADLSGFNMINLTNAYGMFYGASLPSKEKLFNLSNNTKLNNISFMFAKTPNSEIDVTGLTDNKKITNMNNLFYSSEVKNIIGTLDFSNCTQDSLEDYSGLFFNNGYDGAFLNCDNLETVTVKLPTGIDENTFRKKTNLRSEATLNVVS